MDVIDTFASCVPFLSFTVPETLPVLKIGNDDADSLSELDFV